MPFLWTIIGGIIIFAIINSFVKVPGQMLGKKFADLGILQGKTLEEIVEAVGNPSSVSATLDEDGQKVSIYQWIAAGYHIVLLFDENDICLGVSSETAV